MTRLTRTDWGKQFDRCWICGNGVSCADWRWLETHEIARGVHRSTAVTEVATWFRTCNHCHEAKMPTIAGQLALKRKHDPENYDRVAVNLIRDRQPDAITEQEIDEAQIELIGE